MGFLREADAGLPVNDLCRTHGFSVGRGTGTHSTPAMTFGPSGRDGTGIVFGSTRKNNKGNNLNVVDLYRNLVNGPAGSEELLLSTSQPKFPMDWSADGRFVLYDSLDPKRGFDMWALPMEGDHKEPFAVVQTDFDEGLAQFSPDGTWIAYRSDKTGRLEIYLRPFRAPGGDVPVSIEGGAQVRWNPTGKELFYIAPDGRLMAISIRFLHYTNLHSSTPI